MLTVPPSAAVRRKSTYINKPISIKNSTDYSQTMASLRFYYDLMSQPSRAVYLFLKINKIPFEAKPVALRKGEHKTPEYTQINPFQKVPAIDDGGFILTESVSILSYLSQKYQVASNWYPRDLRTRARVDEYNGWQHVNTRLNAAMVFRVQVIEPRIKNIPVDQEKLRRFQSELEVTLDQIENYFLKDHDYLAGDDMSVADLLGICELMQPLATGRDVTEGRPKLASWMARVKERLEPHFDEAHAIVYRLRDMFVEGSGKL